jgi:hypothetical protein
MENALRYGWTHAQRIEHLDEAAAGWLVIIDFDLRITERDCEP